MLSDEKGRGRPAKLILTKEQLSIQIHGASGDDASSISGFVETLDTALGNKTRVVNVPKTKEGLGLSIKVNGLNNSLIDLFLGRK